MNSADLFSFLEEEPMDTQVEEPIIAKNVSEKSKAALKRKAQIVDATLPSDGDLHGNEPGPSTQKKPRVASPIPVVIDEFETEASREVDASAGLTGGVEAGSRLELKHQVSSVPDQPMDY